MTAVSNLVVMFFGSQMSTGALGLSSNAVCIFFSCSLPSFGGTGTTIGFKKFSGIFIYTSGCALAASMILNVPSSQIFSSDDRLAKAAKSWSVAANRLSNRVITCSFMAVF